jgi:hypothetical protein
LIFGCGDDMSESVDAGSAGDTDGDTDTDTDTDVDTSMTMIGRGKLFESRYGLNLLFGIELVSSV